MALHWRAPVSRRLRPHSALALLFAVALMVTLVVVAPLQSQRTAAFADDCVTKTIDPMETYRSWNIVSYGDAKLNAETEGAVAVAGKLSFTGEGRVNIYNHPVTVPGAQSPVALIAGSIDFNNSSGWAPVMGGDALIADMSNASVVTGAGHNQLVRSGAGPNSTPRLQFDSSYTARQSTGAFNSAVGTKDDAIAMSELVATATPELNAAAEVTNPWGGQWSVRLTTGKTNIWNISAADFNNITEINFQNPGPNPATGTYLIVNVIGSQEVKFNFYFAGAHNASGILFNMPDVTSVKHNTLSGMSIQGSILAPKAHLTKNSPAQNIDGTSVVSSGTFDGGGGYEQHHKPFTGTVVVKECNSTPTGTFSLKKALSGVSSDQAVGKTYTVTASWTDNGQPQTKDYVLSADGSVVGGDVQLPVGTEVSFAEKTPVAEIEGFTFQSFTVSPQKVTIVKDGNTEVTVTNTYQPIPSLAAFTVTKTVVDPQNVAADKTFVFAWSCIKGNDVWGNGTLDVKAGETKTVSSVPVQSHCTISESDASVTGATLETTWTLDGQPIAPQNGEVSFILSNKTTYAVTATNTYTPVPKTGTFKLKKALVGVDVSAFDPDATITVNATWTLNGQAVSKNYDLPVDGTEVQGETLPVNTLVTFSEVTPNAPLGYTFDNVEFSPSTITITEDATDDLVTVTNTYTQDTGAFTIAKLVEDADSILPASKTFTFAYTCTLNGATVADSSVTLTNGATTPAITGVPVGASCTVTETGAEHPGSTVATTWTLDSEALTPVNGSVTFTVSEKDKTLALVATNAYTVDGSMIYIVKQGVNCDTDQAECLLLGAEFDLYDTDPATDGATPISGGVTQSPAFDGFATSTLRYSTDYWLVETKAPAGHALLATPIKFQLTRDAQGSETLVIDPASAALTATEISATDQRIILKVKDVTPVHLPQAGGSGFLPFALAGMLLMGVGVLYTHMTSRKRLA